MTFFSTSEKLEVGDVPFVTINKRPTRTEALEYYRRVALSYNLPIHLFEEVLERYRHKANHPWCEDDQHNDIESELTPTFGD